MKNNNSTKKTVTILSLAMVLVLPVTSHAEEQINEEKPLNTQNYMGGGTETKLEEELSALIDKEKADDKEVSIDKESSDEIESSDIETSNSNIEDKENLAETENIETDNKDLADDVNSEKEDNPKPKENYNSTEKVESDEVVKSEKETEDTLDKNDNEELEISNEFNESQLRTANPSRDISNKLKDVDIKIYDTEEIGKLKSFDGEDLGWSISFKAPTDVQPGDEFTITLSDNWSLKGIEPDTDYADPIIDENGVVIAEGKRTDRNHIVYTFTESIRGGEEISGKINSHGYDVKEKIKYTKDQTFEISVGDKSNNKNLTVDYGPINVSDNWNANGKSQFISNDEKTGEYKQVFYINPNKETITASDNHNISFYIDGVYGEDGAWKKLLYPQDNTTVTVNKVSQNETLPDAVYENPVNYDGDSDTDVIYNFNNTGDIVVNFKSQSIDSSYVVTVTSKAPAGIGPYTLLSKGTIYGNPQREENLVLGNGIINRGGDASGTNIKKRGSFKETHVYITKDFEGNVVEDKTITEPGKSSEGTKEESYTSAKVDKDGYVFTKVTADEGSDEVTISEDGKSVESGNYVEDKNLSVTYEYVKQPGRFVEHHIYKTVDKDGNEVSIDKTVNNPKEGEPAKEGFSNEKITTAQRPEDGYTFDSETTLESENYVPGKVLEKTYIYTKTEEEPVAKKGSFKETHVYITKDFEGNVVEDKTITEPGKSSEGTKEESYTSAKVDKDGYVFTKVTADEGSDEVTISEDGKSVESGNYVEDKNLSVTYEYVKQPGRFVEHHIYKTVDKDGNEVSIDKTVNNPKEGEPAKEGFSNEKITTAQRPEDGYTFDSETTLESENYVPGKVLEKTYIYTKTEEEPVAKKGSFKETHVYITKDFEGNVVEDKTITEPGKSSEGTKEESYTSAKVDKDGYVFTKVTADEGSDEVTISEDGKSVESGNYVEDKNLSVTYEYVKQPGRFVEHHIYKTVDKDGNEVSIDKTVNNPKEGEPAKEGFSNEKITTAQRPEDGYSYDSETTLESENYVPGKTLEKTYVYVKTQEDPEKPVTPEKPGTSEDPEKPVTPEKPGTSEDPEKPVTPEKPGTSEDPEKPVTPEKPGNPENPEKPVTPEKPGNPEDPKKPVTPEKPGTPEDPEKPVTPEKPGNPEDPKKPVTPEKPGKPSEPEKPTNPEKPVTPVKPQNPESQGTNNPSKDQKVENPNTPTKTMETIKTHGSTKQASKNPKTGLGSSVGIAGIAISSILASIRVEKKKKEDK